MIMMSTGVISSSNSNGNGNENNDSRSNNNNVKHHHHHHRRSRSFNAINKSEHHRCFSTNNTTTRPTPSLGSSNHVSEKLLGKLFAESEKLATSGFDDLLSSSTDGGKHDYDWLLTPPRSPDCPAAPHSEIRAMSVASKSSLGKPATSKVNNNNNTSTSRGSSASQIAENKKEWRAGRNSSATSYSSNRNSWRIVNNTSSASSSRPLPSTRPSQIPRPSSLPPPLNSVQYPPSPASARSFSRPCTPTRRHYSTPSPSPTTTTSSSTSSRSSSTSQRRPQPVVVLPDFPVETPPNLRTTLPPDRPVSAGRFRPGVGASAATFTASFSSETQQTSSASARRRQPSPIGKSRCTSNGYHEPRSRVPHAPSDEVVVATAVRRSLVDSNGIGIGVWRSISKKSSLDMAISCRHMEMMRSNSSGSLRSSATVVLFPKSKNTQPDAAREREKESHR